MQTGTIIRLTDKGFGFIKIEGQEKDLFFHANELQNVDYNDLKEGQAVEFKIVDGDKGKSAIEVSIVTEGGNDTE